ncbi:unnamed protein product [Fusarium graminearum]|uniref:Uncharacterized protein n=1 Tax=Gibberella zeae TaxID=5518 RepID=A0A9N8ND26_GIBZA|nr:unnamed protein product [Fusarium graminearum]
MGMIPWTLTSREGLSPSWAIRMKMGFLHVERSLLDMPSGGLRFSTILLAKVHFVPANSGNDRHSRLPTWNSATGVCLGGSVVVQYELLEKTGNRTVVGEAVECDDIAGASGVELIGFTLEWLVDAPRTFDEGIRMDHVFNVCHPQDGSSFRDMDIRGAEGWAGMLMYMKNVIRQTRGASINPMFIKRRPNAYWEPRSGLVSSTKVGVDILR